MVVPKRGSLVTVDDVAAHAGVSRQTVSNALNAPQRLKPKTLHTVLSAIDELGYRPNQAARALRTSSTRSIGCRTLPVDRRGTGGILDRFLYALCDAARQSGFGVLCHAADSDEDEIAIFDELSRRNGVDGFVISGTRFGDERSDWLRNHHVPFVSFGRPWGRDPSGCSWVDIDGAGGIRLAVEHLHAQRHRRIGFVGWEPGNGVGDDRLGGWVQATAAYRLPNRGLAWFGPDSVSSGVAAATVLMNQAYPPTALVCASDALAVGAMRALEDRGLRPGPDVSVIGFDDSAGAQVVRPGLTTLHQPLEESAECLVTMLLAHLRGDDRTANVLLEPTLVIRDSSIGHPPS